MGNIYDYSMENYNEESVELSLLGELFGVQSGVSSLYETANYTLERNSYAY